LILHPDLLWALGDFEEKFRGQISCAYKVNMTDEKLSISFSRDIGTFFEPRLIRYSLTVDIGKPDDTE